MKSISSLLFCCLLAVSVQAQEGKKSALVVSDAVLKTAEWGGFKYMENLDKAQAGNQTAIKSLLEFSGTVEGAEALEHATTCLDLIPLATDEIMGSTISSVKPKLKTALLERFVLAQGRTKNVELQKPLAESAPLTWKALNGERVVCNSCMHENGLTPAKPGMQRPDPSTVPAATDSDPLKRKKND